MGGRDGLKPLLTGPGKKGVARSYVTKKIWTAVSWSYLEDDISRRRPIAWGISPEQILR